MNEILRLLREWLVANSHKGEILDIVDCKYDPDQGIHDNVTRIITELADRVKNYEERRE